MFHNKKIASAMAFVMFAALIALGVWQLQRLAWKEDLLAKIEARRTLPAEPLPEKIDNPEDWEFRTVTLQGKYVKEQFLLQPRTLNGKVGYHLVMPFKIYQGGIVYVNRGWVSDDTLAEVESNAIRRKVEGVVQIPYQGSFTPDNDVAKGVWYWPDIAAMDKKAELKSDYPFIVTRLPGKAGENPVGVTVAAHLRNDHKLYAMFWFGMAMVLVVVFVIYQKKQENA